MNVPESQREGKALKAFLVQRAHRRSPRAWVDPTDGESPERLWERLFLEYGGADLPDVGCVPDGVTQCVYLLGGW